MQNFDVFNGDADGVIGLHILRLEKPLNAKLITGVKRDIQLLTQLNNVQNASLTVLDISLASNQQDVLRLLDAQCNILWFDHHQAGDPPDSPLLSRVIDTSPDVCTSILVHRYLGGKHPHWAAAAAFGDNLPEVAKGLCQDCNPEETTQLQQLGETINYNGYGEEASDLNAWPADVYLDMHDYTCPFTYLSQSVLFQKIQRQKLSDEKDMTRMKELVSNQHSHCVILPRGLAARRLSGVISNRLASEHPNRAHAVLTHLEDDCGYRVSIRAPFNRPRGADCLASQFPTGGGRAKAAGINCLKEETLNLFLKKFSEAFVF